MEKLLFVPDTTKKCIRSVIRRKIIPVNKDRILRKPIKAFNSNSHSINDLLLFI
jgi:hypothetical protein